ncbi:RING finger protein 222 [Stigmatopora argus]
MSSCEEDPVPQEDPNECPVCYEVLPGTERTLSCGHVFCHDCLVKMLISIHTEGQIRDTIACPVCRHLTFIRKRHGETLDSTEETKEDGGGGSGVPGQTLEVPVGTPLVRLEDTDPEADNYAASPSASTALGRLRRFFCRGRRRQGLVRGDPGGHSQIFVISARGRPMTEEDTFSVVLTVVRPPQRRRRRRSCSTSRCLVVLLTIFTMIALVAAVLPWILIA